MIRKKILFGLIVCLLIALATACGGTPTVEEVADVVSETAEDVGDAVEETMEEMEAFMASSPECIAPANPGGGWDFTCRSVAAVLNDTGLVTDGFKVTNLPGGGGGVAYATVVSERNDDDNLIIAASPATTLRIAQGQYGDFGADDVRWLGAVGADFAVLSVAADSDIESLEDLAARLQADPKSVAFGGGSAVGGQDHMKVLVLAQALGVDPLALSYTPFDGGGEALTSLLGGFVDVFPGDASEVLAQVEAGEVRVIAALTPKRLAAPLDTAPTAKELGYDAEWIVFRGFYGPGNMSDSAFNYWSAKLGKMAASPEWEEVAVQGGLEPFFIGGDEFESFINEQVSNFTQLSIDLGIIEGSAAALAPITSSFVPSSPECIAPANPGGGWDFTCRSVAAVLNDTGLVADGFKVTNLPGGGGGVAFATVVSERNDDDNLFVAASPATTLRIAQGQYGDFGADDVRWLGAVGADFAVLSVAADSEIQSLEDLAARLQADPKSVTFGGGSAVGGQDHMKVLVLAQALGVDPLALSYTPFDGGGEALTSLLGGFIDVFPGDASEVLAQVEAGEVRVIASLTPERLAPPLDDAPTAKELGYDAEWIVFRGFYGPGNMSDEAFDYWAGTLEHMAASPEWEEVAVQGGLEPFFIGGDEFEAFINNQVSNFIQLSVDLGLIEGEAAAPAAIASNYVPASPECIAPANPGGGWDFTCRSVAGVLNDTAITEAGFKVTNLPGGGGGVAFATIVSERNDGNDLIAAASPATTLRIAQGQYGDFGADDVRWLGAVGADFAVLAVSADSEIETLEDMVVRLQADPKSVIFGGGSAVGGQDHMKVLVLAQALGIDPLALSYTPFDGGGEALTSLLGGFIDVFPGDASEVLAQVEAGEVRVIAALTPERLAAPLDTAPTAKELGYDAEWVVFRGFYAPAGMTDDAYNYWVGALEQMAATSEWQEVAVQGGLEPFFMGGDAFQTMIEDQIDNFRQLSIDLGLIDG